MMMYINGVKYVQGLMNGGIMTWVPCPDNPQRLWTRAEWEAVANFQEAELEFQRRMWNVTSSQSNT